MKSNLASMVVWKNEPNTWLGLPGPEVPTETLPGLAFSQAISSFRLFAGKSLRPTISDGCVEISPTGSRSLSRSIGRSCTRARRDMVVHRGEWMRHGCINRPKESNHHQIHHKQKPGTKSFYPIQ